MPTLTWKLKSRIETFLHLSDMFKDLVKPVLEGLNDKDVFFVEIGANDGISHDQLYPYISKRNWSGVYVEPQKPIFDKLVKNMAGRNNLYFENIAITETEQDVTLYVPKSTAERNFSGIATVSPDLGVVHRFADADVEKQVVKGKPFSYLVDKYDLNSKKCLILMIDVEGYEKNIILSIDFNKVSPKYILFEHAHLTYDGHRVVNGFLADRGYRIYIEKYDTLAYKP